MQNVAAPYLDWVDGVLGGPLTAWVTALLGWMRAPEWLISLATGGIIAGVGGVLVFLPGLFIMYLALAAMEDSGYMKRAAFVMDRAMGKLGCTGVHSCQWCSASLQRAPSMPPARSRIAARLLTGLLIPCHAWRGCRSM